MPLSLLKPPDPSPLPWVPHTSFRCVVGIGMDPYVTEHFPFSFQRSLARGGQLSLFLCFFWQVDLVRESSAPQLTAFRDRDIFTLDADFKTAMEDMNVVKKHIPAEIKVVPPEAEESETLYLGPRKPSPDSEKSPLAAEAAVAEEEGLAEADMVVKSHPDMFAVQEAPQVITDPNVLAEVSRQAGIKYIVFPKVTRKRKTNKTERYVTNERLVLICKELNQPPRILLR